MAGRGDRRHIAAAGNTVVPAVLALEAAGYRVTKLNDDLFEATSNDGSFVADDPVTLLGLIKLVELRSWTWRATDAEIDSVLTRFGWAQ
jgi:hypothetical protein